MVITTFRSQIDNKVYKVANGTYYNCETENNIIEIIENARLTNTRLRFQWGDTITGKDWGDVHNVTGYIRRSMGPIKIPILVCNKRSLGGHILLNDCIALIKEAKGKKILYQHPKYHI